MMAKFSFALPLLFWALFVFASPLDTREAAPPLLEELLKGNSGPIQQLIRDILNGVKSAISDELDTKPALCLTPCCKWWDVSAELTKLFKGPDGECNDNARAAIRLGFHDAGSWDKSSPNGGADGSLLMDFGEETRPENNGLQDVRILLRGVQAKYGVGYADLAQYAHNHATITCPKGPRVRTFVGRKDAKKAAPTGLLPDVHASPDSLIKLFQDKGFSAHDLAALVGAHAAAKQRSVDTSKAGFPLDTTPGVWDVEFYNDTLQDPPNPKIFVLPSDKALSTHPQIKDEWLSFVGNQKHWNEDYARAYLRMSLTGVDNILSLTDCTRTLPRSRPNGK